MHAVICDRCGKIIPSLDYYTRGDIAKIAIDFILPNPFMGILSNKTETRSLDICLDCSKELKKIFKEKKII